MHPCFVLCETSRESGRGEAGVLDGPPLSPQRTPPSASASVALEHHGSSSSYLVRSHDALELSFRSERSQLPGLALWAACAAASATGNTGNIAPKTENLLGKCRAPNAFRSPRGNQGVYYRGEKGRQMSVHQVRFSSVREPTTTDGRIAEELLKNCCVGCRIPVLGLGTHSFDRGGSIDRSINRGSRPQTRA